MSSTWMPLAVGFAILTAGIIGLATVQPRHSTSAIISALWGVGFSAPLCLIIAALSRPVLARSRRLCSNSFTVDGRMDEFIPSYVGKAAVIAGLPGSSVPAVIGALVSYNMPALATIPGVAPVIIGAGVPSLKQAAANSIRVVFMIAAPFRALAVVCYFFLGSLTHEMNSRVDVPVEELHAKYQHHSLEA
ncbi:hypothetical protein VTL71DRAFT_3716 [Oculimacula yallundae]|uniref:Uncharacterized protein n=1 Tax=Oculimacula yallundae TaxID=86028 RepID=A0ABR4C5M8_9HELO